MSDYSKEILKRLSNLAAPQEGTESYAVRAKKRNVPLSDKQDDVQGSKQTFNSYGFTLKCI